MPDDVRDTRAITPTLPSYDALMRAGLLCGHVATDADRAFFADLYSKDGEAVRWRRNAMKRFTDAAALLGYRLVPVAETAATTREQNP